MGGTREKKVGKSLNENRKGASILRTSGIDRDRGARFGNEDMKRSGKPVKGPTVRRGEQRVGGRVRLRAAKEENSRNLVH